MYFVFKCLGIVCFLLPISGYNTMFHVSQTSGWWRNPAFSRGARKVTNTQSSVMKAIRHSNTGFCANYAVVNSDGQLRTNVITTFHTMREIQKFSNNSAQKDYIYRLRLVREGGSFWDSLRTNVSWNPDEY